MANEDQYRKGKLFVLREILRSDGTGSGVGAEYLLDLLHKLELDEEAERRAIERDRKEREEADAEVLRRQEEEFLKKTTMGDD